LQTAYLYKNCENKKIYYLKRSYSCIYLALQN